MKPIRILFTVMITALVFSCSNHVNYVAKENVDANGYKYITVSNDPYNLRIYTLNNGLTAYLSVNKDEPRVQSFIAVKAGSTYDPADNTGLAHYLEHMMFKGTSKLGTVNWEEEKVLIQKISDLFEEHKSEQDPVKKREIYKEIDKTSQEAAKYVATNEYDLLLQSIGGKYTNAYTTNERTVFMNNVPANEIDKWLQIESERFFNPVLRVFHTELETVYEEFNMGQDRDWTKAYHATMATLFPKHPYGQQTTIGIGEHLKNPSMVNILKYQHTYYVPNNMAICLSGDLDQEETIKLIDKYFGSQPAKDVPKKELPVEEPITKIVSKEVLGPQAEFMFMAFRFDGVNTKDQKMVTLIDYILNNSKAGLIDIDLNQGQKVLKAGCSPNFMKDYGMHVFNGTPRQGQTLEEVQELLIGEIQKLKNGEFEDWLMEASINNMKLDRMRELESNNRAHRFAIAFANGIAWDDFLKFNDELSKITKEEIVAFANEKYNDNYIVVYKRKGEDPDVLKIEKPSITPVNFNRENKSEFAKNIESQKSDRMKPVFLDYKELISTTNFTDGVDFSYIKNSTNELFKLIYNIDMGKNHSKELALDVNYLPFLGTSKYSPAELQQEFFKYGLNFGVNTGADRSFVYISGLEDNVEKAMELMEHLLSDVVPDNETYDKYVEGIAKKRADKKLDKNEIMRGGLLNYGKYGAKSGYTDIIQLNDMETIDPASLTDIIKGITSHNHQLFYYGQKSQKEVNSLLKQYHVLPKTLTLIPQETVYPELPLDKPKVLFVDYDMVQTQMLILSKVEPLNISIIPKARLFNEFYGAGLSSIVFQEIRESRALAYTAYSYLTTPGKPDKSHYLYSYVATQSDKLKAASDAMLDLLKNMPEAESQFETSKDAILKKIETERVIKDRIYWNYVSAKDKGIDYDIRKDIYEYTKTATMDDFKVFFEKHISNNGAVYLLIGKKSAIDFKALNKLGEVK